MPLKIALLIDADNISYKELPRILDEARACGQIILQAVYGDWEQPHLQNWRNVAEQHQFHIRHQTNNPNTKNSTDSRLMLEAMDIFYRKKPDGFCLVTNDADYIPLCDRLHEVKKRVIGIGYQRASEAFIKSCDQFIFIGERQSPAQPTIESLVDIPSDVPNSIPTETTPLTDAQKLELQNLLSKAIAKAPHDADGWVDISQLGTAFRKVQVGFAPSNYGYNRLNLLLSEMLDFVDVQEAIPTRVQLKMMTASKRSKLHNQQKLVVEAFASVEQETDGSIPLQTLGSALRQIQDDFTPKNYGFSNLRKFLQNMSDLVELQLGSPALIRLKNYAAPKPQKSNNLQKLGNAKKLIIEAFAIVPQATGKWVTLSAVGTALSQVKTGFSSKTYGHSNLTKLLQSMPDLVELQFEGKVARLARLKK